MVDIPLQFFIGENLKNNAVKSYKQCHEIWHQPDVHVHSRVFWQAPLSSGLRKGFAKENWHKAKLSTYNSLFVFPGINYFKIFKTIVILLYLTISHFLSVNIMC